MEENKIDSLVVIEQLPIIKQQLQIISDEVDKEIEIALSLECDEDSKTEVKKARARLNKIATTLEEKRKQVKNAIMNPYQEFENIYNELVKDKLKNADNILKEKIQNIEIEQINEKLHELENFANEYFIANNIQDLVKFEDIGLNITLSASMKSLKDKIIIFCEKITNDLKLIELEEYKDEILLEYKKCFDFHKAKLEIIYRHDDLEELKRKHEELEKKQQEEQKVIERVEEVVAPIEIKEENETITTIKFYFKNSEEIKVLSNFLKENNIKFEII